MLSHRIPALIRFGRPSLAILEETSAPPEPRARRHARLGREAQEAPGVSPIPRGPPAPVRGDEGT